MIFKIYRMRVFLAILRSPSYLQLGLGRHEKHDKQNQGEVCAHHEQRALYTKENVFCGISGYKNLTT